MSVDPALLAHTADSGHRLRLSSFALAPIRHAAPLFLLALATASYAQQASPGSSDPQPRQDKKCETLQRHIAKEQSSLESFEDTLAKDKKGRESCSTKPMCMRYDQAIKAMEARKSEHAERLAKFKADAEGSCKPS